MASNSCRASTSLHTTILSVYLLQYINSWKSTWCEPSRPGTKSSRPLHCEFDIHIYYPVGWSLLTSCWMVLKSLPITPPPLTCHQLQDTLCSWHPLPSVIKEGLRNPAFPVKKLVIGTLSLYHQRCFTSPYLCRHQAAGLWLLQHWCSHRPPIRVSRPHFILKPLAFLPYIYTTFPQPTLPPPALPLLLIFLLLPITCSPLPFLHCFCHCYSSCSLPAPLLLLVPLPLLLPLCRLLLLLLPRRRPGSVRGTHLW